MSKKYLGVIIGVLALITLLCLSGLLKGGITGNQVLGTRLVIIAEESSACNFTALPGWNLVSFPCLSSDMSIRDFLNSSTYGAIRYYSASDLADPWKSYNPSLPSWVIQDLPPVSRRSGYWLQVANTTGFYVNNTLATPTLILMKEGWNLIGYPSKSSKNITLVFNGTIPDFAYVYTYNASDASDPWKQYTWNLSSYPSDQDLETMVPYAGYWVLMVQDGTVGVG